MKELNAIIKKQFANQYGITSLVFGDTVNVSNIGETLLTACRRAKMSVIIKLNHTQNATICGYLEELLISFRQASHGIDGKFHDTDEQRGLIYGLNRVKHGHEVEDLIMQAYAALLCYDGKEYTEEIARKITNATDKFINDKCEELKNSDITADENKVERIGKPYTAESEPITANVEYTAEELSDILSDIYSELTENVQKMLDNLDTERKKIMLLFADGFTLRKIAEVLKVTYGKVQRTKNAFISAYQPTKTDEA